MPRWMFALLLTACCLTTSAAADSPMRDEVLVALNKAADFFHDHVADHGGYVWRYSGDLSLREGEAKTDGATIWVQPPGTPTIGEAYLDAYEVTLEKRHLQAARDVAEALLAGQLHSGGWNYSVEFDPTKRAAQAYRIDLASSGRQPPGVNDSSQSGWEEWKQRKYKGNMTVLDDDTTQSAVRFLMRLDRQLNFKDARVHEAVSYALDSLLKAQYPCGAWSHCYDRFPQSPPSAETYPILQASFPPTWSRTWTKDWTGGYRLNDRISLDLIKLMFAAHKTYGDDRYLQSAKRGGDFLLLAQLPEPQPAWAQQYNRAMQPVWDRKFEPPAITGLESQDTLETLLLIYRETGDKKYLQPVPRAIAYLRTCELKGGKLARFYEIETNKPLYFTRDYKLTYSNNDAPKHYGFQFNSRLDSIEAEYKRLLTAGPAERSPEPPQDLRKQVRRILEQQDSRGAWVERVGLDAHDVTPESGVIQSQTFADNIRALSQFLSQEPAANR
jgi:hypothetical protein